MAASAAAGAKPGLLLLRRTDATFSAAPRARFRVLDFYASGAPLRAFLANAAAEPDPPRAALVVAGGAVLVDAAFLDAVPSLRCVVTTGAGVDHVDLAQCARRGVAVAGAGKIFSVDVADPAVGLLVSVLRRVSATDRYVRAGLWPAQGDYQLTSKLSGKRVGVIGLGSIGSLIAKRLEAFGCVVSYHSRAPKAGSVPYRYFPDARPRRGLRRPDRRVLDALGPGGVLVNIARGGNVDERELIAALREGRIAGAGLDVFENEPHVPPELRDMDSVVLTAHEAAFTEESTADLRELMIGVGANSDQHTTQTRAALGCPRHRSSDRSDRPGGAVRPVPRRAVRVSDSAALEVPRWSSVAGGCPRVGRPPKTSSDAVETMKNSKVDGKLQN